MLHAMQTPVTCYADSYYTLFAPTLCVMHTLMHCTPLLWTTCILLHAMHTCCMLFTLLLHNTHPHYILCAPSCTMHTPTMHYMYPVTCYAHPYYALHTPITNYVHPVTCYIHTLIMSYIHSSYALGAPSLHTPSLYSTWSFCFMCTLIMCCVHPCWALMHPSNALCT